MNFTKFGNILILDVNKILFILNNIIILLIPVLTTYKETWITFLNFLMGWIIFYRHLFNDKKIDLAMMF